MLLHLYGEPLVSGIIGRALGHCPAQESSVPFQAEIVVISAGYMVLNHKPQTLSGNFCYPFRFQGSGKIPFLVVFVEFCSHIITPVPSLFHYCFQLNYKYPVASHALPVNQISRKGKIEHLSH
ncbi:hypothetical protein DSBG_3785 [Desulfosporosinus sp. BG]|nr:hypothetical protein DSBG_3785 [Desulfosporosinus sp. BG]